jgi:hypothetical protein
MINLGESNNELVESHNETKAYGRMLNWRLIILIIIFIPMILTSDSIIVSVIITILMLGSIYVRYKARKENDVSDDYYLIDALEYKEGKLYITYTDFKLTTEDYDEATHFSIHQDDSKMDILYKYYIETAENKKYYLAPKQIKEVVEYLRPYADKITVNKFFF